MAGTRATASALTAASSSTSETKIMTQTMVDMKTQITTTTTTKAKSRSKKTPGRTMCDRGVWSEAEHDKFLVAIKLLPKGPWKAIADAVGTRSARQVQTHAQKYYEKVARRMRGLRKDRKRMLVRREHRLDDDMLTMCNVVAYDVASAPIGLPIGLHSVCAQEPVLMQLTGAASMQATHTTFEAAAALPSQSFLLLLAATDMDTVSCDDCRSTSGASAQSTDDVADLSDLHDVDVLDDKLNDGVMNDDTFVGLDDVDLDLLLDVLMLSADDTSSCQFAAAAIDYTDISCALFS